MMDDDVDELRRTFIIDQLRARRAEMGEQWMPWLHEQIAQMDWPDPPVLDTMSPDVVRWDMEDDA